MNQNTQTLQTEDEVREKVALRAYEIYEDRGGQHGRDIDDWLQAEAEVLSEVRQHKQELAGKRPPSTTQSAATAKSAATTRRTAGSAG
jgi:hypothetical protein